MRPLERILAITALAAVIAGCSVGDAANDPEPVASSSAALTAIPAEMPSIPRAAVAWQTPNPTGTMGQGDPLFAVLKNNSATSLSLRLSVLSTGLDQRVASTSFGTFVLPANSSQVFGFPVIALPVQSVGTESEAELQVDVLGVGGAVLLHVPSAPIFYQFNGTYTTATMWGSGGKDVVLGGTPPTDPTALIQSVLTSANAAFTLRGRVWNGSTFVDVRDLPIVGSGASLRVLGTYVLAGPRAQGFLGAEISQAVPYPPPQPVGQFPYTICAQLSAELIDAGYGEPRAPISLKSAKTK